MKIIHKYFQKQIIFITFFKNDEFCENKLDAPYLYLYYMCTNHSVKHRTLYEICNGIINC